VSIENQMMASTFAAQFGKFAATNRYKYNDKEYISDSKLYDYGARHYDPLSGRWWVVDPLAEKREWLTSYNYVSNNPISRTDPTGMLDDDYTTKQDGSIEVVKTNDKFDRFFIENKEHKVEFVTQIDKNENGLLNLSSKVDFKSSDLESSFSVTLKEGNGYRAYIRGDAAAALFGAASETNFKDLGVVGFSLSDGASPKPSTSHKLGKNGDLRYLNTSENGGGSNTKNSDFDVKRNSTLTNALFKYGWKDIISEKFGNGQLLPHTSSSKDRGIPSDHTTHLHLQGFNPKIIRK
jgi:RHS repeat-associated protein